MLVCALLTLLARKTHSTHGSAKLLIESSIFILSLILIVSLFVTVKISFVNIYSSLEVAIYLMGYMLFLISAFFGKTF